MIRVPREAFALAGAVGHFVGTGERASPEAPGRDDPRSQRMTFRDDFPNFAPDLTMLSH